MQINGLHHVTAISGPARRNLDFYARVLGLRLVKKTVNFDDPGTYHLYFGDADAAPGSILTFFPWEHAAPGRLGVGETQETVYRVPEGSIGFWAHRFVEQGVPHEAPTKRFGETVLSFRDPDGMRLALVGLPGVEKEPAWAEGGIPAEHALRGFHSVSLLLADAAPTGAILDDVFGFTEIGREDTLIRYAAKGTAIGGVIDLRVAGGFLPARQGAGSVHHIAFRRRMTPCRRRWCAASFRTMASAPRNSATGTISARSISVSPAMSCSRSRPISPASRSTSPRPSSAVR